MVSRPLCIDCGAPAMKGGRTKAGRKFYKKRCSICNTGKYKKRYRNFKKDHCERCGFLPEDPCQLDVDHIDGNKRNDSQENLQTLCANCHRLKTKRNKDWVGGVVYEPEVSKQMRLV